ncbi:MAG: RluA family pseudouridine synthase [Mogibacterium sp.]|nr:RluA family pseudouridine synthase [Mogibacterium sp.]
MTKYTHTVTTEEEGLTINQILRRNFRFSSRFKTKMKFQELVDLNGVQTPGYIRPSAGDLIGIRLPTESSDFPPEDIPVHPLYEDADLLILDKQPGITVHPTKGHPYHTLANGIMKYMQDTGQQFKVRFANRLDMDTSGIVIVAKNANAQNDISDQMRKQTVRKRYRAVVHGVIDRDAFTIDLPIGRPYEDQVERAVMAEGGKDAVTDVRVLERYDGYTLVELTLHTGRTHQIRVHLSHIGYPIVGDHLYGGEAPELIGRQALHSCYIAFRHPITGADLEVRSDLPEDILACIQKISGAQQLRPETVNNLSDQ